MPFGAGRPLEAHWGPKRGQRRVCWSSPTPWHRPRQASAFPRSSLASVLPQALGVPSLASVDPLYGAQLNLLVTSSRPVLVSAPFVLPCGPPGGLLGSHSGHRIPRVGPRGDFGFILTRSSAKVKFLERLRREPGWGPRGPRVHGSLDRRETRVSCLDHCAVWTTRLFGPLGCLDQLLSLRRFVNKGGNGTLGPLVSTDPLLDCSALRTTSSDAFL